MTTASPAYVQLACDAPALSRPRHPGLHNRVVLLRWRGKSLATFGLLAGLGGALATTLVMARQVQAGMAPGRFALVLWLLLPLTVIVGARLLSLSLCLGALLRAPWPTIKQHGYSFQGGLLLVIAGLLALAAAYDLDPLLLLDTAVLGLPLGHALGRLGCHTYGCCHGRPTTAALAIRYSHPESKAVWRSGLAGVRLHPTQLYSAAGNLALFGVLSWMASRPLGVGQLTGTYLALGSAGRLLIELLRGVPTPRHFGLTPFQWVAAGTLLVGLCLVLATATGSPTLLFQGSLYQALGSLRPHAWAPLWVCFALLAAFGIHGPRIGDRS